MNDQKKYDLNSCDREPIHEIGFVQPFGALIAANSDWFISQRSVNIGEMLKLEKAPPQGANLSEVFSTQAIERIQGALSSLTGSDDVARMFGVDLRGTGDLYDCAVHCPSNEGLFIIEFEPHQAGESEGELAILRPLFQDLEKVRDHADLFDLAATQLRDYLGYDRVMVYKFHPDGTGEVIAEAKSESVEAFLNLRYPRTDIPQQARELFVRNRFRIIADMDAEQVEIQPDAVFGSGVLDLSMSVTRAHSQMHVEYMRNMGVGGSLAVSIIVDGELWGMFSGHHESPKMISYPRRTAMEFYTEMFSLMLQRSLNEETLRTQRLGRELHDKLMRALAGGNSLADRLPSMLPAIKQVVDFDGASIFIGDVYETHGTALSEEEFRSIVPALNATATSQILTSSSLQDDLPGAAQFADRVAGAIIIPISRSPRDFLALWRKPLTQTVTWAGDPKKQIEEIENEVRLSPRKSFAAWQETVEGHSAQWSESDLEIANGMRTSLLEIILRFTEDAVKIRAKAQEQQELLIAELNHRVRNILNLIRSLISQSRHEAKDIDTFSEIIAGRVASLAAAHDNITDNNWSYAPFRNLIESEVQAYLANKGERVTVSGPRVDIAPEAYTVLALVFHEMVTNSAKYGALCDHTGCLDITLELDAENNLSIAWVERDGPKVKPPKRRGFGTAIIEKSIPFELNGKADIRYEETGVTADFWVPGRFVEPRAEGGDDDQKDDFKPDPAANGSGKIPQNVMIVEDSMIIAMEAEDCLKDLGVEKVEIAGSVPIALDLLKKLPPQDLVILDFNLGDETSEPIAKVLAESGTPFVLATGYGEMGGKLDELGAQGLLTKPYGKKELEALVYGAAKSD